MKKLLDETSDELTRSLLLAGRSQRPPAASRARLLVALGAAGGVGLFSSKAFAWLSTSAGKLTLLGVGVAVAGGAYTLATSPTTEATRVSALSGVALSGVAQASPTPSSPALAAPALAAPASVGATDAAQASAAAAAPLAAAPVAAAAARPQRSSVPASAADASASPRAASPGLSSAAARRRVAPTSSEAHRSSRTSSGTAARRDDALERMEPQRDGSLSAELEPPAGRTAANAPGGSNLEAEIQLVDAMRGAAQRQDAEALRRLMADYQGSFPEGQLKREVSELALRTLSPAGH